MGNNNEKMTTMNATDLEIALDGIRYAIENFGYRTAKTDKLMSKSKQEQEVKHLMEIAELLDPTVKY